MIAEAVRAAAGSAAAVVVVGSAEAAESEGIDRETLALPGRQDELVTRIAAVNPRTVVVVNAGMPVLMPWADDVAAVIYAWLPGQAMGEALADVLLGRAEPGGRLPVTLPVRESDCPVLHAIPRDGRIDYAEGLLIGYRGYDAAGITPMFAFGHGLGYTEWAYESASLDGPGPAPGEDVRVRVALRNTGSRPGREIVQAYVASPVAAAGRPGRSGPSPRWARRPASGRRWCSPCRPGPSPSGIRQRAAGPGRRAPSRSRWADPRGTCGSGCRCRATGDDSGLSPRGCGPSSDHWGRVGPGRGPAPASLAVRRPGARPSRPRSPPGSPGRRRSGRPPRRTGAGPGRAAASRDPARAR